MSKRASYDTLTFPFFSLETTFREQYAVSRWLLDSIYQLLLLPVWYSVAFSEAGARQTTVFQWIMHITFVTRAATLLYTLLAVGAYHHDRRFVVNTLHLLRLLSLLTCSLYRGLTCTEAQFVLLDSLTGILWSAIWMPVLTKDATWHHLTSLLSCCIAALHPQGLCKMLSQYTADSACTTALRFIWTATNMSALLLPWMAGLLLLACYPMRSAILLFLLPLPSSTDVFGAFSINPTLRGKVTAWLPSLTRQRQLATWLANMAIQDKVTTWLPPMAVQHEVATSLPGVPGASWFPTILSNWTANSTDMHAFKEAAEATRASATTNRTVLYATAPAAANSKASCHSEANWWIRYTAAGAGPFDGPLEQQRGVAALQGGFPGTTVNDTLPLFLPTGRLSSMHAYTTQGSAQWTQGSKALFAGVSMAAISLTLVAAISVMTVVEWRARAKFLLRQTGILAVKQQYGASLNPTQLPPARQLPQCILRQSWYLLLLGLLGWAVAVHGVVLLRHR